jgi:prepilin-type N-terminal cleavage/methylation domain-containing protein
MFDVNANESLLGEDLNMNCPHCNDYLGDWDSAGYHIEWCPKRPNRKGFTLMELMIVAAIVFILAAMIAPNIARYFEDKPSKPVTNSRGLR